VGGGTKRAGFGIGGVTIGERAAGHSQLIGVLADVMPALRLGSRPPIERVSRKRNGNWVTVEQ
jgi:hypothetical protein